MLNAKLTSNGTSISQIDKGLMVLCGINQTDNELDVDYLVPKLLKTKLWDNAEGLPWKASAVELGYQILLVS